MFNYFSEDSVTFENQGDFDNKLKNRKINLVKW